MIFEKIKNLWSWLGKDINNKAIYSIVGVLGVLSYFVFDPFDFFKSVEIISYDNRNGLVIQNALNEDIFVSSISTRSLKDPWSLNIIFLDTEEKIKEANVEAKSIKFIRDPQPFVSADAELTPLLKLQISDEIIKKSAERKDCLVRIIYSKGHPQLEFLNQNMPGLAMLKTTSTLKYFINGKQKTIDFLSVVTIQKQNNCVK